MCRPRIPCSGWPFTSVGLELDLVAVTGKAGFGDISGSAQII